MATTAAQRRDNLRSRAERLQVLLATGNIRGALPPAQWTAANQILTDALSILGTSATTAHESRFRPMSLSAIHVDPPRFQPREQLDTNRVERMAATWDERAYTPIVVWLDPADNRYYVLAGHHRLAAMKHMGRREALVQVFEGDQAEAIAWAWESNAHSAAQSAAENARYLRKMLAESTTKADVRRKCKELYDANCTTSWLLAHLHPEGEAYRRLSEWGRDTEGYRDMETMARWIGSIRETFPNLTLSQENEITRHLFDNYKTVGRRFRASNEYESFVASHIRRRFPDGIPANEALALTTHASKTDGEKRIDVEMTEARQALEAAKAKLAKMQTDIARSKEDNAFGLTQEGVERALTKASTDVVDAEQRLMALRRQADSIRAESRLTQHALFDNTDTMTTITSHLADIGDNERAERLRARFIRIAALVSAAEAKIPAEQASAVRQLLASIGATLGVADVPPNLPTTFPNRSQTVRPPESSIEPGPTDTLDYDTYFKRVGTVVRQQIIDELQPRIASLSAVSADKKASESRRTAARNERDELKKQVTRLKNNDIDPGSAVEERIASAIRSLYDASGGRLTPEQARARLTELHEIAFSEESKSEDFYPTPDDIIEKYLIPRASLQPGNTVLEPSAGRGNIARAIRRACSECDISVVEINSVRREILALEGFRVVGTDFWEYAVTGKDAKGRPTVDPTVQYDRVIMNPPFDKGIGLAHIKRAFQLLKPGGTLVAIMPEGYLFGTSRANTDFQQWARKNGALEFEVIKKDEYNANHDRKILIHIALLTIKKPLAVEAASETDSDTDTPGKALNAYQGRVEIPDDASRTVDADFVPPNIVTASPHLAQRPQDDHIPPSLASLPFLKRHVLDGANLAIEALTNRGGFLLADGTGTGKTIQSLLVAEHFYRTTGQPVLIFTVDERVLATSFGDDARKLGFNTPNIAATVPDDQVPRRPKNYAGLYDGQPYTLPNGNTVDVWRHGFGIPLRPGINLCTYHDLSQYKGGDEFVAALNEAQAERREIEKQYRAERKDGLDRLDKQYPKDPRTGKRAKGIKDAREALLTRLNKEYNEDHPSLLKLYAAQKAYTSFLEGAVAEFAGATQLIIFDEAHKVKNAGDGVDAGSRRAELALILINYCPKVMYVTATPADRPFDVLYLKKAGLFKDDDQFKALMYEIGYEWKEPKKNDKGEQIADGGWRLRGGSKEVESLLRANAALSSSFDMLTEDGQMLRREIEMTNLTVEMHKMQAPSAALALMTEIEESLTEVDENGRETKDLMQIYGRQLEELEPYKLAKAVEIVDEAVKRGKQVIVFVQTVEQGKEIRKITGQEKPGAVRMLKDLLAKRYGEENVGVLVGTSGEYEDYRRMENVRDFQAGKRRVLIGTITSGGTGLNLDDTTGRAPRELIIVTPPLSFINVVQAVGRVVRANTKSRSVAHFIFTDNTDVDSWLSRLIATKFASLNAVVKGETSRLDLGLIQNADNAGETGVVSAIAASTAGASGQVKASNHSRYSKRNQRVNGMELPSKRPYYCELSGTPKNSLISFGAASYADLQAFMKDHAEWIEEHGLRLNPDEQYRRFNGPYIGREIDRESAKFGPVWNAVLNMVDFEVMDKRISIDAPFAVGDSVTLAQDIKHLGLSKGTLATVTALRKPRYDGDTWRIDLRTADTAADAKAIEAFKLHALDTKAAPEIPFTVGTEFAWSVQNRSYGSSSYEVALRVIDVTPFDVQFAEKWKSVPSYKKPITTAADFSWPSDWPERDDAVVKTMTHADLAQFLLDADAICVGECAPWDAAPKPTLPTVAAKQTWQWKDDDGNIVLGYIAADEDSRVKMIEYETGTKDMSAISETITTYQGAVIPWRKAEYGANIDSTWYNRGPLARKLAALGAVCVDGCTVHTLPDGANTITTAVADDAPQADRHGMVSLADDMAKIDTLIQQALSQRTTR